MPAPVEYTNAKNKLISMRDSILGTLVAGRVKAGLDAGHDSMQKFSKVIQSFSVTPYLFGEVQRKALALQLKGLNIGTGKQLAVRGDYALAEVLYPITVPAKVPYRKVPQVDVFQYTPVDKFELLDKSNLFSLQTFFSIKCPSGTFKDTPDVENATYDYYLFSPHTKRRGNVDLTGQYAGYESWKQLRGECIMWMRTLFPVGQTVEARYDLFTAFDISVYSDSAFVETCGLAVRQEQEVSPKPQCDVVMGGRICSPNITALYCMRSPSGTYNMMSMDLICANFGGVPPTIVWQGKSTINVAVNDSVMGYTTPAVGTYKYTAGDLKQYQAFANAGYVFDHWERDGINVTTVNPMNSYADRDHTYKAVFVPT